MVLTVLAGLSVVLLAAAAPTWISVSTSTGAACPLEERLAASLEQSGAVVPRGRPLPDALAPNDLHIEVLAEPSGKPRGVLLEFVGVGEHFKGSSFEQLRPQLERYLKIELKPAPPAANATALSALCQPDAPAAYKASGAAVTRSLARRLPPPPRISQASLHVRWAAASAFAHKDRCSAAVPRLRRVISDISRGILGPVWRRPPPTNPPTSIASFTDRIVVFEAGRFVGLDQRTGEPRWQLETGSAEPRLVELDERRGVAVLDDALIEIDTHSGRVLWKASLPKPHAEIAFDRDVIYAASAREIVAVSRKDGSIKWRYDGLKKPAAGPVRMGGKVVAPLYDSLVQLDPKDGSLNSSTVFDDEISGPLVALAPARVWVLLGSDELALVDAAANKIVYRTKKASGIGWPMVPLADVLLAPFPGRRPRVGLFDPSRNGRPTSLQFGKAPILLRPDLKAVVHPSTPGNLVARDVRGRALWRAKLGRRVRDLRMSSDAVVVAVDRTVFTLDQLKGKSLRRFVLDTDVAQVTNDRFGGAALMTDGTVYGLPSARDPRPAYWLSEARLELARCQVALRQRSAAVRTAREVLARHPEQRQAWAMIWQAAPRFDDRLEAALHLHQLVTQPKDKLSIRQKLGAEFGLTLLQEFEGMEELVVTSSATAVVRDNKGKATGIELTTGEKTFSKASKTLASSTAQWVIVDGQTVDSQTGAVNAAEVVGKPPRTTKAGVPKWLQMGQRVGDWKVGRFDGRWLVVLGPKPK